MRSAKLTDPMVIRQNFPKLEECKKAGINIFHDYTGTYCYTGGKHVLVEGRTGMGKSTCVSNPTGCNVISKHANGIFVDPKGELYNKLGQLAIDEGYRVITFDFRHPYSSPNKVNILRYIYDLYQTGNKDDVDRARNMLGTIVEATKLKDAKDEFWPESASDTIEGSALALNMIAPKDEVNLASLCSLLDKLGHKIGGSIYAQKLVDQLPENSPASSLLQTFTQAPHDTRQSIYAMARACVRPYFRSEGLLNMLSCDDVAINDLDIEDTPFLIFIIIPDDTSIYHAAAGVLVTQITNHFVSLADSKYSGTLPQNITVILEELGNIRGIPLPFLTTASRSRGLQLIMVVQDERQLYSIYGEEDAQTILSNVDVMIGFSTYSNKTLNEWSERCGEKAVFHNGSVVYERVMHPWELEAMDVCQALVFVGGRYKFIADFPFYDELYDTSNWRAPTLKPNKEFQEPKIFDVKGYIDNALEKKRSEMMDKHHNFNPFALHNPTVTPLGENNEDEEINFDKLMRELDDEISKRTKEEKEENNE